MVPANVDLNSLASMHIFRDLTSEQRDHIRLHLKSRRVPGGSVIISADEPGEVVYIIERGAVRIHVEQADGSGVILAILAAGDIFGEMSMVDHSMRCASVITIEDSVLLWVARKEFELWLTTIHQLTLNLMNILNNRLRMANEQILAMATKDVERRIARQLLVLADSYGLNTNPPNVEIPIRLTQRDFAELIGATRERVNQVMTSYKKRRYISVDKDHHITITNYQALSKRIQLNT